MKIKYLVILLLLVPFAKAENLAYEGWVFSNRNFIFDGNVFRTLIGQEGRTMLLQSSESSLTLPLGDCITGDYVKYCFNLSVRDNEAGDYKGFIRIYYLEPELKITRKMKNPIIIVGESAWFEVTISNTGEALATEINYTDVLSEGLVVEDVRNAEIKGNSVVWTGQLKEGESREIEYLVRAIGPVNKQFKARARYFDGFRYRDVYSDAVTIYSTPVVNVELKASKEDYEILEDIPFSIKFTNSGTEKVEIGSFSIIFPEALVVKKEDVSFNRVGVNAYEWKGKLDPNENKTMRFTLSSSSTGVHFVLGRGNYSYKGEEYLLGSYNQGILVHQEGVDITASINPVEYLNSNQMLLFFVKVKNKNSFTRIKNITLETFTDIAAVEESRYSILDVNQTALILSTEIKIPDVDAEKIYPVKFNLTYFTENNERFSSVLERKIVVRPFKPVSISPSFSSLNIIEDQEVRVAVEVQNKGEIDLNSLYVISSIPKELSVKGASSTYIDLPKGDKKIALSFMLRSGRVEHISNYPLNFTVRYVFGGREYLAEAGALLTVEPRNPTLTLKKSLSSDSPYKGEIVQVYYELSNDDTVPIFDIMIKPSELQELDYLGPLFYSIQMLYPGEKIIIKGEQIKSKATGILNTGRALALYRDEYSREFNTSSGGISFKVNEAIIQSPSVYITQELADNSCYPGEDIKIILNVTNLGLERAVGVVEGYDDKITLSYLESRVFEKTVSFEKEGTYVIPKTVFYFMVHEIEARAYSNELTVEVKEKPTEQAKTELPKAEAEESPFSDEQPRNEEQGFFSKFFNWLRNLFFR